MTCTAIDSVMENCIADAAAEVYGRYWWLRKFCPDTHEQWQAFLHRVQRGANDPRRRTLRRIWLRAVALRLSR